MFSTRKSEPMKPKREKLDGWTEIKEHWAKCAAEQPDLRVGNEEPILVEMFLQYRKLKDLGWNDIIYCPKDGTTFLSISAGSTGVHPCHYSGEWPNGAWWVSDAGDIWPAHPILWKAMPKQEEPK